MAVTATDVKMLHLYAEGVMDQRSHPVTKVEAVFREL
jgi:hypothetical protein